jgi:hypothetical protein
VTAQDRGWGPPCSGRLVTLVRTDGLRLPVRAELAELTTMLLDLTEMGHGYDVLAGQTWGYSCRKISGTTVWSNHAWGLAVDINAPSNPYASADWHRRNARGTRPFGLEVVCNIPEAALAMWETHGYRLGVKYVTKPDPMHVEFMGTPTQAAYITARLRTFLHSGAQPPPPPPAPKPAPTTADQLEERIMALPTLRRGATGQRVRNLQALLIAHGNTLEVDGDFGSGTEAVLRDWQRRTGALRADGIAGPATWAWLIGI